MTDTRLRNRTIRGFTLVESIVVILIIGILAAISAVFIVQPFEAARDMTRRAELVDAAETALDRMTREIRLAVPNSVRVDGNALEFLRSKTGGRYRKSPDSDDSTTDKFEPDKAADTFDVLGGLPDDAIVDTRSAGRDCATPEGDCLVVNNTRTTGFDAYKRETVAALVDPEIGPDQLRFDTDEAPGTRAFSPSGTQRFQVIDTVVSYVCDDANRTITRYFDYGLNNPQETTPDGPSSVLANDVTACSFTYDVNAGMPGAGAGPRHGLVTIDIKIERDGETVRLIDQAHVVNPP